MNVLIACESSGTVRDAFLQRGHNAWSCDLLPADDGGLFHYNCDVKEVLYDDWDLVIAHPPCTYLSVSGLHWNKRRPERAALTEKAAEFFMLFADLKTPYAIENPVCCMSSRWRKPDQIIQPYHFGHNASKKTCLWLNELPKLEATKYISPRIVGNLPRWDNQTDSGQNNLPPSKDRWKLRSKTYNGIAQAMADQWGALTNKTGVER